MTEPPQDPYHELYVYTMSRGPSFPLQHVVDAHAAQMANADTKPIGIVFALVGLYLLASREAMDRRSSAAHPHATGAEPACVADDPAAERPRVDDRGRRDGEASGR